MQYSKDNKFSANIVIVSLLDKFMAFSLSFFPLLEDSNKLFLPSLSTFSAVARNTATECHLKLGTLIFKIAVELFNY